MTQALLLNGAEAALRKAPGQDHETPLFFFLHTVTDDLRQAEMNLALGYTVAVAWALRDALEAIALAALLWRDPSRSKAYWDGEEFAPRQVRKDLEALGLWSGMVGSLWTTYTMLSLLTHPNVDRLAQVMDERRTAAGVVHTFNAGGTRHEDKLRSFVGLTSGCCVDVVMLVEPILKAYLSPQDGKIFETCARDVARKAAEVLEASLAVRHARPSDAGEAGAYERRLRRSLEKPMAMMEEAVNALGTSANEVSPRRSPNSRSDLG
jgi:hypothetical protein